jgi:hypothetical protein
MKFMLRAISFAVAGGILSGIFLAFSAPAADAPAVAKAEALMAAFRTNSSLAKKEAALRALEKSRSPAVDDFLVTEFGKLDNSKPEEHRLAGGILKVWAVHPDKPVLPYLIYEGLFHEDAEVVRACAGGIALASEDAKAVMSTGKAARDRDPAEELAADLVHRLSERPDLQPAIERVLVLWSGKARPGHKPDADLKRTPGEKERNATVEFWRNWFEQRFKRKLSPA